MNKYALKASSLKWCFVVFAAFAATWLAARDFPGGNNVYHLPLVLDYFGSAEGPHDSYHESFRNFTSYFWTGVAAVATERNVRPLFLGLLLAGSLLTTLGGYALARAAGASAGIASLGGGFLALAFAGRDIMEFGGGELFSGFVTHSQFATAVVLFAVALAARERWVWAAALCGAAADLNLFLGAWAIVNLIMARVLSVWLREHKLAWRGGLAMSGAWFAASAPVIIWALGTVDSAASDSFSFPQFIKETFPYHSYVHMEAWTALAFASLVVATCIAMARIAQGATGRLMCVIVASAALTVAIGAGVVYLNDSRMIQNLYPLRYAAVAHWITAAGVIATWAALVREGSDRARFGMVAVLGFSLGSPAVSILGLLFMLPPPDDSRRTIGDIAMLAALAVALVMPALTDGRVHYPSSPAIGQIPSFLVVCLVGAAVMATTREREGMDRWLSVLTLWIVAGTTLVGRPVLALPLAASATVLAALAARPSGQTRKVAWLLLGITATGVAAQSVLGGGSDRTLLAGLGGMIVVTVLLPLARPSPIGRMAGPLPLFTAAMVALVAMGFLRGGQLGFDFPRNPRNEHWKEAQLWARKNTPPDTYFFAPDRPGFATLSRRPLWWEENAFAVVMWKPSFYAEWSSRKERARLAKNDLDLGVLAREVGIPYLTLDRHRHDVEDTPGFVVRYCNDDFCIVQVENVRLDQSRLSMP